MMPRIPEMQAGELADRIKRGQAPVILDVRTCFEFRDGHIPGAINAPVWKLVLRLVPLPRDRQTELVVLCALGPRAMMGKIVLGFMGYGNVALLAGHMAGWRRCGLPLQK